MHESVVFYSTCTVSWRKFTFAISSPDEFLVLSNSFLLQIMTFIVYYSLGALGRRFSPESENFGNLNIVHCSAVKTEVYQAKWLVSLKLENGAFTMHYDAWILCFLLYCTVCWLVEQAPRVVTVENNCSVVEFITYATAQVLCFAASVHLCICLSAQKLKNPDHKLCSLAGICVTVNPRSA